MKSAVIAFLFFISIALLAGPIKVPTTDDLILIFASFSLLIMAWLSKREKNIPDKKLIMAWLSKREKNIPDKKPKK